MATSARQAHRYRTDPAYRARTVARKRKLRNKFEVGDKVMAHWYAPPFPAVVRAVFVLKNRELRYAVESANIGGAVYVLREDNLEARYAQGT